MCNLQGSDAIQVSQRQSLDLSSEIFAPLTLLHPLSVDFWTQWSLHKGGIEAWFISATIALFLVPMVAPLSTCTFFLYFICLHNYFVNGNFTRHPSYPNWQRPGWPTDRVSHLWSDGSSALGGLKRDGPRERRRASSMSSPKPRWHRCA